MLVSRDSPEAATRLDFVNNTRSSMKDEVVQSGNGMKLASLIYYDGVFCLSVGLTLRLAQFSRSCFYLKQVSYLSLLRSSIGEFSCTRFCLHVHAWLCSATM